MIRSTLFRHRNQRSKRRRSTPEKFHHHSTVVGDIHSMLILEISAGGNQYAM
ncbi:MAG: hypothetical protein IJB31_00230 [Akkermansia sp.]|nr:hypothetical protein [Akkermansia sp.]